MFLLDLKMKKQFPRPVLAMLITGLMIVSIANLISRKYGLSDGATGFVMGIGIGLEIMAVILGVRYKKTIR
jgi:hypothetical protein